MQQHDLNRLKRAIAERMLFQMKDEALGELIVNMKEMLEFYGTRSSEEKRASLSPVIKKHDEDETEPSRDAQAVAVALAKQAKATKATK